MTIRELEKLHILATLKKNGGNKPTTAKELGITLKTLYNKLNLWDKQRIEGEES